MHVTITETSADGSVVRFHHDAGLADGIWRGDSAPELGPVDVELVMPGRFWWQDDLRVVPRDWSERSRPEDEPHLVTGVAEAFDDRGVLTLRVGDGRLQVTTGGPAPRLLIGEAVEIDSPLLELHPVR